MGTETAADDPYPWLEKMLNGLCSFVLKLSRSSFVSTPFKTGIKKYGKLNYCGFNYAVSWLSAKTDKEKEHFAKLLPCPKAAG